MEKIDYICSYKEQLVDVNDLTSLKSFIHSKNFLEFTKDIIIKLSKTENIEKIDLFNLFEECGLLGLRESVQDRQKSVVGIERSIFTMFLKQVEKQIIDLKLSKNEIKSYEDIIEIQIVIKNIDTYFSYRGLVNFSLEQHEKQKQDKEIFLKSLPSFKEYLNELM